MSRWRDQSIHDERNPHFPVALDEVVILFGTLVAETILASVHVRAPKQAGHMDASDLIKALQTPCKEGAVHIWRMSVNTSASAKQTNAGATANTDNVKKAFWRATGCARY